MACVTPYREEPARAGAYHAAREDLAHRARDTAVLDVEGPDRESFLQGQLTQDVRSLTAGQSRPAAALTPKGKLLFTARLLGLPDRIRLLLPAGTRESALAHLRKFAAFQRVSVEDRSSAYRRLGLYGPRGVALADLPAGVLALGGEAEFSCELLVPIDREADAGAWLNRQGAVRIDPETADILRVEAGRPRFGQDVDNSNLPDEAGLDASISFTKGCYVGQEVIARRRTYGRLNRRLIGYRFPEGILPAGTILRRLEAPGDAPEPTQAGRVTSSVVSPRFGPIGLGFAFHDVSIGDRLVSVDDVARTAVASALPFA
jgi:tRNA-modifying protein YgfZ